MRFWNELIGEPRPATVKTKINLHRYATEEIISFVKDKIITRDEVIESGVVESMFTDELADFIYPRDVTHEEVTMILNRRYADKKKSDSGENP